VLTIRVVANDEQWASREVMSSEDMSSARRVDVGRRDEVVTPSSTPVGEHWVAESAIRADHADCGRRT